MLFLPIDKSLFNAASQHAKNNSVENKPKPRRRIINSSKTIERAQTASFAHTRVARHRPANAAMQDIQTGTEKAASLIDYMRSV